jgi:hypothetical protein
MNLRIPLQDFAGVARLAHRAEAAAVSFDFRLLPALLMQIKAHPRKAD